MLDNPIKQLFELAVVSFIVGLGFGFFQLWWIIILPYSFFGGAVATSHFTDNDNVESSLFYACAITCFIFSTLGWLVV